VDQASPEGPQSSLRLQEDVPPPQGYPESVPDPPLDVPPTPGTPSDPTVAPRSASVPALQALDGTRLAGDIHRILKDAAPAVATYLFFSIKHFKDIIDRAQLAKDLTAEIYATSQLNKAAAKTIEMATGKKITMGLTVTSQEDLTRWEQLSPDVRAAFLKTIIDITPEG